MFRMDNEKKKEPYLIKGKDGKLESRLAIAIRNTTPEQWRRKLAIAKFRLEMVPNEKTVYH